MPDLLDYRLMVAPNGARRTTADHPALPVTSLALAQTARACQAAGASAIHVHVRDEQERHSLDAGRYRDAVAAITEQAPGLGIQITTESAGIYQPAAQLICLTDVVPQAASIAIREMAADPSVAQTVYAFADEASIEVQHIAYTPACVQQLRAWQETGLVRPDQNRVLFVLGQYAPPRDGRLADLAPLLEALGAGDWKPSICAFGAREHQCLRAAMAQGFGARIGFENSISDENGVLHRDNAASIRAFLGQLNRAPD